MMDDAVGQPGPHVGRPQAMQNDKYGMNGDGNVPTTPTRVTFDSQLGSELRTHGHGQADVSATRGDDHYDDNESLFGSSKRSSSGS